MRIRDFNTDFLHRIIFLFTCQPKGIVDGFQNENDRSANQKTSDFIVLFLAVFLMILDMQKPRKKCLDIVLFNEVQSLAFSVII